MPTAVYSTETLKDAKAERFDSMQGKVDSSLLKALNSMKYEYMTPVQSEVLTGLPSLRSDCLVQAKTGTGKTTAFLLPALQSLLGSNNLPKGQVGVLILSPTRELALQIAKECDQLTSQLPRRIECHTAFGGTARSSNLNKFMAGSPSILVATPGRLKDYLSDKKVVGKFQHVQTVILDEADTMLEQGFLQDVSHILQLLPPKSSGWQGMCFSATVPAKIKDVISRVLKPGYTSISTIDKSEPPTHARVPQYHVILPSVQDTFAALLSLLQLEIKETLPNSKIIVFGTTANLVALYAKVFEQIKLHTIYTLHSRMSQSARTRTTDQFKVAKAGIMFATDVIGRGMDFPNVGSVIQVGLPSDGEQYVHRVGRTARVDKDGRAVILLTKKESFFINANRQLPIQPYAHQADVAYNAQNVDIMRQAMRAIDSTTKQKAYSAYMGFSKTYMNKLQVDASGVVALANELAIQGMGCDEPPLMEKKTIGKMGLKGARGIRYE
ncbi:MAG: hypothetical protein M1812_000615 [Candelaria pacifica]|nr:MAG: hypothetical protein M1812_000615 [Candelaria pacifica]